MYNTYITELATLPNTVKALFNKLTKPSIVPDTHDPNKHLKSKDCDTGKKENSIEETNSTEETNKNEPVIQSNTQEESSKDDTSNKKSLSNLVIKQQDEISNGFVEELNDT
jgi:hypothetical protein